MSTAEDFLVEIGTEELPPKALKSLSGHFRDQLEQGLRNAQLGFGGLCAFASPRRLAVLVEALAAEQPDQLIERRGPAVAAAFDSGGRPTPAALGFAKSCGIDFAQLERTVTEKGEWLIFRCRLAGRPAVELLPPLVAQALDALPVPKRMRWGERSDEFVRPVHWVLMLYGHKVVPGEILGIASGDLTHGHRFLGAQTLRIDEPGAYAAALATQGHVIADFAVRRARVQALVLEAAAAAGGRPILDDDLLDEVTALVEWPVPVSGSFDAHFLDVPREALIATMQGHQKYFPVEDLTGRLTNRFITVSNLESRQPELVRAGNERVIRPRLSDAAFFWAKDCKTPLAARLPKLGDMVFERRLGSLLDKTERIERLARAIAADFAADPAHAARAARLSRCDLVSEMVGEFPELQGIMGGHYACHDGEAADVAAAVGEFYLPRYAGDTIPASAAGRCIAVAEKLDTLVGIFGIGALPTGDRDPFALRRAALGCLRICIEGDAGLDLMDGLKTAGEAYAGRFKDPVHERVFEFIMERSRAYFAEHGVRADLVEAVLATRPTQPRDLAHRIAAVETFMNLPEALALAAANKRIANILKKSEGPIPATVERALLREPAERALADQVSAVESATAAAVAAADYRAYLERLARLHDAVNAFFDHVLVMADDAALRGNRLALLKRIHGMFLTVADISLVSS